MARRKPKNERTETDTPKARAKRTIAGQGLTVASHAAIGNLLITDSADALEYAQVVMDALDAKIRRTEARKMEAAKAVATA